MKLKKLTDKIVHCEFETKEAMNKANIRMNCYIDNPRYRELIFTLGQIRHYYIEKYGFFNYYERIEGSNLSRETLEPFIEGLFDPLSSEEEAFLKPFRHRLDNFFILITYAGETMENRATFYHELAHALFYTDKDYREKATAIVEKYKKDLKPMLAYLKKTGYHKDVFVDETQAFVSADYDWLALKKVLVPMEMSIELQKLRKSKTKGFK